jgi:hypothetical protein
MFPEVREVRHNSSPFDELVKPFINQQRGFYHRDTLESKRNSIGQPSKTEAMDAACFEEKNLTRSSDRWYTILPPAMIGKTFLTNLITLLEGQKA